MVPDVLADQPRKETAHRALDDIRESIEELRFYRERLFVPAASEPVDVPQSPAPV